MRAESASLGSSEDRKCPAGRPLLSLMAKDRMWIEFYGRFKRDLTLPPKYMSPIRRCARALARLSIASPFRGTPRFDIGGAKSTCTCGSTRKAQTDTLPTFRRPPSRSKSAAAMRASRQLRKRWDRRHAHLDLILQERGADVADLPGGASGLLARG
jgi:hypothetical protein